MSSRPTPFVRDAGLQMRMTGTLFLLGLVYAVLVAALLAFGVNGALIAVIAGGMFLFQLFASDKLALAAMSARVVTPAQAPQLHALVDRLCVRAELPKPRIAVADTDTPNAFAIGRSPKTATVCATTGLVELLSPAELEAVMAHELTHVQNRDVMVMTVASFFAVVASYVVQFGFFVGGGSGEDDHDRGPGVLVLMAISAAVYAISFLLMQTLSRYREFSADRGSAAITGRPGALASALIKISAGIAQIPRQDLRAPSELKPVYIFPASTKTSIANLFATHPPLEQRLAALERLEAQLRGTA